MKKTAARTARPVAKKARAVKKTAARKARPVAKKARAVKKTATRKASKTVKKTVRKAKATTRPTATKRTAATNRTAATKPTPRRGGARVDAIALLKQDHREVAALFTRFERAGDGASRTKERIVEAIIEALSVHAGIEELVFYPAVRREVSGAGSDVLEAIEEHHVVKLLLHELEGLVPTDERFDAKVTVMIENVRHHVKEEEQELFPEVRARLGRARLLDLGDELRAAKPRVPTRPHPYAPDEPPANALVGGAVAAIDRARTVGKKAIERVRDEIPSM